jgi:hypothetical protein
MRAFVCGIDHHGLRRLLPEELLPAEVLRRLACGSSGRTPAFVRVLVEDPDAEDLRTQVRAGCHGDAFGLLIDRAVEVLPLGAAVSGTSTAS